MKNAVLSMLTVGAIAISLVGCGQTPNTSTSGGSNSSTSTVSEKPPEKTKFVCQKEKDPASGKYIPTTYAWNPQNKKAIVLWKTQYFKASGYDPQKRCEETEPRFNAAYQDGRLKNYLTSGELNKERVICAVNKDGEKCDDSNILITLRKGDNADVIIENLKNVLADKASQPLTHSNGQKYYKITLKL